MREEYCFFGGTNGLNIFHPNNITDNHFIPPVVFSGFEILNKDVAIGENYPLKKSITTADGIYLDYNDYMFTFRYAALNFTNSQKNQYQYILEGFDKEWNKVGVRRFATYTNIPGGNYVFKVRASNNSGIWNEQGTSVRVLIAAPFWQKTWFQIPFTFLLLFSGYGLYKYRVRSINAKKKELERIVEMRTDKILRQKIKLEQANQELSTTLNKLKETQTQLIQSEKMATLGQLTAGVAHEINNPVNFIYSGINGLDKNLKVYMEISHQYQQIQSSEEFDTVKRQINDLKSKIGYEEVIEDIQRMMSSIKEGAERTANIVKGLQIFSRSDDTIMNKTDVHEGLESTLLILNNRTSKNITLYKKYDGTIPKIECYPGQLHQVFMNILSNAIEAIGDNQGTIAIETINKEEQIVITIEDTGEGIPSEVQARIFEPFFTTKEVGKGTGLGLSISYGIIKKHNGTLTFTSKLGQGTKFTISLPKC